MCVFLCERGKCVCVCVWVCVCVCASVKAPMTMHQQPFVHMAPSVKNLNGKCFCVCACACACACVDTCEQGCVDSMHTQYKCSKVRITLPALTLRSVGDAWTLTAFISRQQSRLRLAGFSTIII